MRELLNSCVSIRSLISIETSDSGSSQEMSAREQEALQAALSCLEACHIGDIFADSKFLQAESLVRLCKAIIAAAGPVQKIAAVGEDTASAEVCLRVLPIPHSRDAISPGGRWLELVKGEGTCSTSCIP